MCHVVAIPKKVIKWTGRGRERNKENVVIALLAMLWMQR